MNRSHSMRPLVHFLQEFFPEESGADPCEEFKKMLDCMNVSETDWKACQMIDQTAKQALPSHRPNGFTHGTHGPGRLQGNAQVPYSLSFTDLAVSILCRVVLHAVGDGPFYTQCDSRCCSLSSTHLAVCKCSYRVCKAVRLKRGSRVSRCWSRRSALSKLLEL
jgi:hypothetical protein